MQNQTAIEIALSKSKMVKMLVGCIVFVLIGIWFLISPPAVSNSFWGNPVKLRIVGVASIIFFGVGIYSFSKKLRDSRPGLTIDDHGIFDNSSFVAAGQVKWEEITGMSLLEIKHQKMILLKLTDPEAIIDRQVSSMKKRLMKVNYSSYGSPVCISANSLSISFTELWDLIADGIQDSLHNEGATQYAKREV